MVAQAQCPHLPLSPRSEYLNASVWRIRIRQNQMEAKCLAVEPIMHFLNLREAYSSMKSDIYICMIALPLYPS